ncbi:MAG: hypothetical protein ACO3A4_10035 [Silvanigrellaceae bacterium]
MNILKVVFLVALGISVHGCGDWSDEQNQPEEPNRSQQDTNTQLPPVVSEPPNQPRDQNKRELPSEVNTFSTAEDSNPATFPVGEIISESDGEMDFNDWARDQKNTSRLAKIGRISENGDTLNLETDATLNFSTFASNSPMTIKTNGNNLTLIGRNFRYLRVETRAFGKDSGSVRVFALGQELPVVDTSGTAGQAGADATCANNSRCVPATDHTTRFTLPLPSISWTRFEEEKSWNWTDSAIPEEWRSKVINQILPDSTAVAQSFCAPKNAHGIHAEGPSISGEVKLRQLLERPTNAEFSEKHHPVPAALFPGQPGLNGFNAGNIFVFALENLGLPVFSDMRILPGAGGEGGKNFKSPASQGTQALIYKTKKISEELDLEKIEGTWKVRFHCSIEEERGFSRPHSVTSSAVLLSRKIPIDSGLIMSNHQINIPELPAGADNFVDESPAAKPGLSGKSGRIMIQKLNSVEEIEIKTGIRITNTRRK